jgi:hypothetical protein
MSIYTSVLSNGKAVTIRNPARRAARERRLDACVREVFQRGADLTKQPLVKWLKFTLEPIPRERAWVTTQEFRAVLKAWRRSAHGRY